MSKPELRIKALLLAGGLGTRLRPITDTIPKCLVPIADRPLLDYWVDGLAGAGILEARINTHAHAEKVRAYLSQVNGNGRVRLVESHEPVLLGSAGTITANADLAEDADLIVIVYADNLSDIHLRPLIEFHVSHDDPFTMVLFRAPNPRACGIAELDAVGRITSFVEKPEDPVSNLANAGLYIVDSQAYRQIAELKAFDLSFEVLPRFAGRMRGWVWGGYHLDIGTLDALEKARKDAPRKFSAHGNRRAIGRQPAVFLDRDGTLIEHVHYLSDPAQVRLLPGAAEAVAWLRQAGFRCVLVTNQSAIGRGMITEERLQEIHVELNRQLAECGTALDGIYFCPDVPTQDDRTVIDSSNRKPGPGMLIQAAGELGLDLASSWMIGDLISDVLAGQNAGCRSVLVASGQTEGQVDRDQPDKAGYLTARDLSAASMMILDAQGTRP